MHAGSRIRTAFGLMLALAGIASSARPEPRPRPSADLCVDPKLDVMRRTGETDPAAIWSESTPDLDGDGHDDLRLAARGWCGSGGCNPWHVYVVHGTCARWVGMAVGRDLRVVRRRSDGWANVRIESHGGYCPYSEAELRYQGGSYREVMDRWCDCRYSVGDRPDMTVSLDDGHILCTRWRPGTR